MNESNAIIIPLTAILCHSPCPEQRDILLREWPNGVPLTEETARRAVELEIDMGWVAKKLLWKPECCNEYRHAETEAWMKYNLVEEKAYEKCVSHVYPEGQGHIGAEAAAEARKEYERVNAETYKEYERAKTDKLLSLLIRCWADR